MGFWVSMIYARRQAERENEDRESARHGLLALALWSHGSALYFHSDSLGCLYAKPIENTDLLGRGLCFYGGFIGAAFTLIYYTRAHKLPFFKYADLLIPFLAMAHAIGRLGCLMAGCCFLVNRQIWRGESISRVVLHAMFSICV